MTYTIENNYFDKTQNVLCVTATYKNKFNISMDVIIFIDSFSSSLLLFFT